MLLAVSSIRLIDLSCLAGRKALARNPKCGGEWKKWDPPQSLKFPPKEFTNENVIVALGFNKDPRRWELPLP